MTSTQATPKGTATSSLLAGRKPNRVWAAVRRNTAPLGRFIVLLFLVTVAVFLILEFIPGDPIDTVLPPEATPEQRAAATEKYGLDDPLYARYFAWIGAVLRGDLGTSIQTGQSVGDMLAERASVSIELAFLAVAVSLAISVPVAVWSAYRPGGTADRIATFATSAFLATPPFVLGLLLVFVFGVELRILPILGYVPLSDNALEHYRRLILPVLTLAVGEMVLFTRLLKGDMMETLQQDHVLSARARGLPTYSILTRHSLRQSSFSLVTVSGVVLGRLIGGTVLVEAIFGIPGMGTMVITAINSRDYVVVQAVVLVSAVLYLGLNALVDLAYPLLDPRVRKGGA
jgi:peptide/nickel transport system permease protein